MKTTTTITKQERDDIVAREDRLRAYCVAHGGNSYRTEQVAHLLPPSNEERSLVEVYDFINDPPGRYFLYIDEAKGLATTWTGDELGLVAFGRVWQDNFGGTRQPVRIKAINGRTYSGTYFKSTGDFARVRVVKGVGL